MNRDTYVIIPVFNEASVIANVIKAASRHFANVVCVDDGSHDSSAGEIKKTSAKLVQHPINLGQGAALQTGIDFALTDPNAHYFITFDADGQHDIADAARLLSHLRNHDVDIVLGSRFLGTAKNMNQLKSFFLKLAVRFSNLTTGVNLTDAHNGLRAFNRAVAENLHITMPDMAHATEIIHRIREQHFTYAELPVTITYTDYSKAKGQSFMNAVNISFDLLAHKVDKK